MSTSESTVSKGKKSLGLPCPLHWPIHGKEAKLTASWPGQGIARNMAMGFCPHAGSGVQMKQERFKDEKDKEH